MPAKGMSSQSILYFPCHQQEDARRRPPPPTTLPNNQWGPHTVCYATCLPPIGGEGTLFFSWGRSFLGAGGGGGVVPAKSAAAGFRKGVRGIPRACRHHRRRSALPRRRRAPWPRSRAGTEGGGLGGVLSAP